MMNKAEKTKAAIAQSLVEMLQRKPLDLITVSDLTANAGVGRTAYYNNFKNLANKLNAIKKASADYNNFSGISSNMGGSVNFVIETGSVSK